MLTLQPAALSTYSSEDAASFRSDVSALVAPDAYSPFQLLRSFATRPHLAFQACLVQNQEIKVLPPSLWIGVSLNGLFLVDHTTKHILKAFKFAHLAGWAANSVKYSVRV